MEDNRRALRLGDSRIVPGVELLPCVMLAVVGDVMITAGRAAEEGT